MDNKSLQTLPPESDNIPFLLQLNFRPTNHTSFCLQINTNLLFLFSSHSEDGGGRQQAGSDSGNLDKCWRASKMTTSWKHTNHVLSLDVFDANGHGFQTTPSSLSLVIFTRFKKSFEVADLTACKIQPTYINLYDGLLVSEEILILWG
ncbi:hypothetical protein L6452_05943 [Arctium lappa]|uniref:Uncharacterized protein n=1 Tax=Arctium lappa TaxID=4217 RepID=A0ACB9EIV0_ARCLA|nr:hypothetical protein L6452_05943 [Arctium lappa]